MGSGQFLATTQILTVGRDSRGSTESEGNSPAGIGFQRLPAGRLRWSAARGGASLVSPLFRPNNWNGRHARDIEDSLMRSSVSLFARVTVLSIFTAVMFAVAAEPPQLGSRDNDQQAESTTSDHERAERELKKQKKQRILGIIPNFNTSNVQNAAPLSSRQKFGLALRGSIDPFAFVAAGLDAALEQSQNSFPGYGQGAQGYGKRVGAAYADAFSANMFGGAIFPTLLHQDPRYFRKGSGRFGKRLLYAVASTVRAK